MILKSHTPFLITEAVLLIAMVGGAVSTKSVHSPGIRKLGIVKYLRHLMCKTRDFEEFNEHNLTGGGNVKWTAINEEKPEHSIENGLTSWMKRLPFVFQRRFGKIIKKRGEAATMRLLRRTLGQIARMSLRMAKWTVPEMVSEEDLVN